MDNLLASRGRAIDCRMLGVRSPLLRWRWRQRVSLTSRAKRPSVSDSTWSAQRARPAISFHDACHSVCPSVQRSTPQPSVHAVAESAFSVLSAPTFPGTVANTSFIPEWHWDNELTPPRQLTGVVDGICIPL